MKNENNYLPEEYKEDKSLSHLIIYLQIVMICIASGLTMYFTWYLFPLHVFLGYLSCSILNSYKKEKINHEKEICSLKLRCMELQFDKDIESTNEISKKLHKTIDDIDDKKVITKYTYRKKLSKEQRSKIQSKAAYKRWAKHRMNKEEK
jgi:hypothetical protein